MSLEQGRQTVEAAFGRVAADAGIDDLRRIAAQAVLEALVEQRDPALAAVDAVTGRDGVTDHQPRGRRLGQRHLGRQHGHEAQCRTGEGIAQPLESRRAGDFAIARQALGVTAIH